MSENSLPNPKTRRQSFLAKLAGVDIQTPDPKTIDEQYLYAIAENGIGSGGGNNSNNSPIFWTTISPDMIQLGETSESEVHWVLNSTYSEIQSAMANNKLVIAKTEINNVGLIAFSLVLSISHPYAEDYNVSIATAGDSGGAILAETFSAQSTDEFLIGGPA